MQERGRTPAAANCCEEETMPARVAIVGSRKYARLDLVVDYVGALPPGTVVISGGAIGPDLAAEATATGHGLDTVVILPDWARHGRAAGPRRNQEIVAAADAVVAFWDGTSPGTRWTMRFAVEAGKTLTVYGPDGSAIPWPPERPG